MSKLLLVEDDNNLREIYEARLQAEGYSIVTAKDGEEALVVAKAEHPDLIISDIMMPKISGFEMLDILRNTENLKNVPVIMLTALGQNDDQQRADKLGADRYLVKSQVTLEDIVRVAHELLGDSPKPENAAADTGTGTVSTPTTPSTPPSPTPTSTPSVSPSAPANPPVEPTAPVATPATPAVATPAAPPAVEQPTATTSPAQTSPTPTTDSPSEASTPPEAASTTTPTPASTPPTVTPAPTSSGNAEASANAAATTAAQEGADVSARIEDFVAGASQDTATPDTANAASPTPIDTSAASSSTASEPSDTTTPTDNQQPTDTTPPADTPTPVSGSATAEPPSNVITPTEPQSTATESGDKPEGASEEPSADSSPAVVHDKVIKPLEADPNKKDINTLLALEAVKEANNKAAEPPAPVIVDTTQTPSAAAQPTPDQTQTPAKDIPTTAVGANPTPSSVIAPVEGEANPPTAANTDISSYIPPMSEAGESGAQPSAGEEAGTDLNSIAL